jgi:hypothetical protein
MERYYANLCVYNDNGHYRYLRVHWLSYTHNIVEAGSELLKFTLGLQIAPNIERVVIESLQCYGEVPTDTKEKYIPILDKYAIREILNLNGISKAKPENWKGNTTHVG